MRRQPKIKPVTDDTLIIVVVTNIPVRAEHDFYRFVTRAAALGCFKFHFVRNLQQLRGFRPAAYLQYFIHNYEGYEVMARLKDEHVTCIDDRVPDILNSRVHDVKPGKLDEKIIALYNKLKDGYA